MLKVGEIIDQKYEVTDLISQTKMSVVYKAKHLSLGNTWIIKGVLPGPQSPIDLLAEPNILRKLNNPNLPRIIDIFQLDGWLYIIEDYIEGIPLDRLLQEKGPVQEEIVIEWGKQLCNVLKYLHSQEPHPIIYRDMKPSNIIADKEGFIKLIDFGISKEYDQRQTTVENLGTKGYAAPEQYKASITDVRTDIYNLGATLYHLLTAQVPAIEGGQVRSPKALRPELSQAIDKIISKCLLENPADRYQSAGELLASLNDINALNKRLKNTRSKTVLRNVITGIIVIAVVNAGIYAFYKYRNMSDTAYMQLVGEGTAYLNEGKLLQSENVLQQAVLKNPDKPDAYKQLFRVAAAQGKYQYILDEIEKLEKNKKIKFDDELLYIKADSFFNLSLYQNAIEIYYEVININPSHTYAKKDLCVALARNGDLEDANTVLDELKAGDPNDGYLNYISAEIDLAQDNIEAALIDIDKALAADDKIEQYYLFKADLYQKTDNIEREIEVLDDARKMLEPFNGARLLERMGDTCQRAVSDQKADQDYIQKSIECYNSSIEAGNITPEIYTKAGRAYRVSGDFAKAEEQFQKALELDNQFGYAYLQLGYLAVERENNKQSKLKDYSKAIQYLEEGIRYTEPDSAEMNQASEVLSRLKEEEHS